MKLHNCLDGFDSDYLYISHYSYNDETRSEVVRIEEVGTGSYIKVGFLKGRLELFVKNLAYKDGTPPDKLKSLFDSLESYLYEEVL